MKKLIILTHPPRGNYGGMLQAHALTQICQLMGRKTFLFDFPLNWRNGIFSKILKAFRNIVHYSLTCICKQNKQYPVVIVLMMKQAKKFAQDHFKLVSDSDIKSPVQYLVGSDQVWRVRYANEIDSIYRFFCMHATSDDLRQSFSYAASFGTDEWEGTPEETERCRELLQQFKAVSVREFSGVRICKEVFDVDAVQMPDPTLLATLEDYESVINSEKTRVPKAPYFASYVLNDSAETSQILNNIEKNTELYHQRLMLKSTARKRWDRFYCTVAQWLRYLRDCEAVVTDSFHGCVFSIIYNKPFVCLGNEGRGSARFDTLFRFFGLEDRLVTSRDTKDVLRVLHRPINWERVNAIHESERQRGLDFLRRNLYDEDSTHECE